MFRILTIIFVIVRISRNIEAATQSSKFRLISNLNLSDSWSIENLIETINIPQTGRKSFNQKRYCLAECDKLSTCILSVYDSVGLTCTFYNSGPQWSNGNYLSAQYSYIKTFYKQLSPSQCSVYQYHDGYSCVKASGYYTSCNQSLTCQTSLGLICASNFCLCAENSYYSQTSCALKQQYQNYCNETVPCDDTIGLVCDSNLCGCSQSYYYNSSACAPQKFVNQSCSSSIECSSAYQLVCLSGICQVNATQGQTCAANCTSDVGLTCLSGVCVCSDTTKAFNGTMCVSPTTIQVYNPPAFNAYYSISYVSGGASKTISGTITAASSKPVTQKLPIDSSSISITFGYVALIVLINIDIATLSVAGGTSICYTITSSHSYTTSTSC